MRSKTSLSPKMKLIILIIGFVVVALAFQLILLDNISAKNSRESSTMILNQVEAILTENEANENELIDELKQEYIYRAEAVAYFLDNDPDSETNIHELGRLSVLLGIDEIHLFDENGTIYFGTEPKYYGYSFDSGEQMAFFLPMLNDKNLSMCQDVTPNTAESKSMMYAITWNAKGTKMVQVGIEPVRLLNELKENEIPHVIEKIPTYEGHDIYVAAFDTLSIIGSTDKNVVGKLLSDIGINVNEEITDTVKSGSFKTNGKYMLYSAKQIGDNLVFVTDSVNSFKDTIISSLAVVTFYLLLGSAIIYFTISKLIKTSNEKNEQLKILSSMAEIYYTMHLIDLNKDSVREYTANNEVKELTSQSKGAAEMMKNIISSRIEDSCLNDALEFTDLSTVAQRMENKKLITHDFIGKRLGWVRTSFIVIEDGKNNRPEKVMFVSRSIDDEKKREEALITKSNTDELTGLLNRRAYEEDISAGDSRNILENNLVYVAFDVNGLKTTNDTLGHNAGDELIIAASSCLKQCLGPYGRLYRTGGDEFAAIIYADADQLEKIKKDLKDTADSWKGNLVDSLSLSAGFVSAYDMPGSTLREIAVVADKTMYAEKNEYYRLKGLPPR